MGHFGSTRRPENMKTLGLLFLTSVACSPVEIINYSDEEAGHGHMMEGVPGLEVEGSYYWKAPDVPEAPMMVLPVMPELTPEVAEARSSFMQVFDEIKMKNVEEAAEVVEDAVVMEKRDADADPLLVQYQQTLPLYRTYAPAYPHYFVYPVQQKVMPVMDAEDEMMDDQKETEMMEDVVRKEEQLPTQSYNPLTSYYPVYQPVYHPLMRQQVSLRAPSYPSYYPGLVTNPSLGSSFTGLTGVVQPAPSMESMEPSGGVLPSETLEGEDESASLLL